MQLGLGEKNIFLYKILNKPCLHIVLKWRQSQEWKFAESFYTYSVH